MKVNWPAPSRLIPTATASIKVDIVNATNQVLDTKLLVRPSGALQVTVTFTNLSPGNHTARATALPNADGTGTALATATTPLVITAGHTTDFTLTLGSTITQIDVTPAGSMVVQGQTVTLTATPRDANGNVVMVAPSQLTWVSSAPSVATVTTTGTTVTATGVGPGTTQIRVTDTESQKTNAVSLTVLPTGSTLYTISELPVPAGFQGTITDINENGDVVGIVTTGTDRTIVWRADGTQLYVPAFPGPPYATGYGINDTDIVVGMDHNDHPFRFDPQVGALEDLGVLPGGESGAAKGINNSGQIVGYSYQRNVNTFFPFIWQNGVMRPIPVLDPNAHDPNRFTINAAYKINNVGQVVGRGAIGTTGNLHTFLWDSRTNALQDLGTLGGTTTEFWGIKQPILDINNAGVVVGASFISGDTAYHPFLWQNGTMIDLGLPPGQTLTRSIAINDNGEVVGSAGVGVDQVTFYWKNGTMVDLKSRVINGASWRLVTADAINNRGMITGNGTHNGQPVGYLLTPQ